MLHCGEDLGSKVLRDFPKGTSGGQVTANRGMLHYSLHRLSDDTLSYAIGEGKVSTYFKEFT